MMETAEIRKTRGAFFTPPPFCDFVSEWAIRDASDAVLEPSCGDAEFLWSAAWRLRALGAVLTEHGQIRGVDIHGASVLTARARLQAADIAHTLEAADFFDVEATPIFDAVIGNPPFIRYQSFSGEARAKAQRAALKQGVTLQGLANAWAAFVVHASAFLKPNGRLGLVLPAELLAVNYAAPVRQYLMRRFASVRVLLFKPRVFPGVQEEIVLLLAEGQGPTDRCELYQADSLAALRDLQSREWFPLRSEDKWSAGLLPADAVREYVRVSTDPTFELLQSWGDTTLGMVTGNNRFFAITAAAAKAANLHQRDDLLAICPPSSRHLRGLSFYQRAWNEMHGTDGRVYLFYPRGDSPSDAAAKYIEHGETLGVDEAYKCRVRSPWWRVPMVAAPDLFLTYMNYDTPRLVANPSRFPHLNSVHGVRLRSDRRDLGASLLPIAALNSITLLGAELVGRSYGGGVLKVEPKEADRLPVPALETVNQVAKELRALRPQLATFLRNSQLLAAVKLVDRIVLTGNAGLSASQIRVLRSAREALFSRRIARAESKP